MNLLTFDEALLEAQEEKEEQQPTLSKIGKAQSYFTFNDKDDYTELTKGSVKTADVFLAGENNFIIDKSKKITISDQDVYAATDDYDNEFTIYIDDKGILYTDRTELAGLFTKILK